MTCLSHFHWLVQWVCMRRQTFSLLESQRHCSNCYRAVQRGSKNFSLKKQTEWEQKWGVRREMSIVFLVPWFNDWIVKFRTFLDLGVHSVPINFKIPQIRRHKHVFLNTDTLHCTLWLWTKSCFPPLQTEREYHSWLRLNRNYLPAPLPLCH